MIKLEKSPLPDGITITKEQDYRTDPVFSIIQKDCYNKCYICESGAPSGLQVEHRISHAKDPSQKYNWENLLLSCYHCNHAKGDHFDGIIDCTKIKGEGSGNY
jgi:5-methylcytosine-specific restriction endonuclease McrA